MVIENEFFNSSMPYLHFSIFDAKRLYILAVGTNPVAEFTLLQITVSSYANKSGVCMCYFISNLVFSSTEPVPHLTKKAKRKRKEQNCSMELVLLV